ncbi:methyltransferase [Thiolapillus sp.]|uniref:methyltransferase n=1 Tax=Thiolapillus sp. TaxID=2017437 RepID=UPI003AF7CE43
MSQAETLFETAFGSYRLTRLPARRRELLRAWDAADEYLLDTVAEEVKPGTQSRILVLNDSFGALAVALHEFAVWSLSDSVLAHEATRQNYSANGFSTERLKLLTSLDVPAESPSLVLIRAPKTLALLEYQLTRLRPLFSAQTTVIVAGMVKNMQPGLWKLLEKVLGPTRTSLARKKARLIRVSFDPDLVVPENPYPTRYILENTGFRITNHANVFSRAKLDIGTRFFLQHLPPCPPAGNIIDLGCGNGVLALMMLQDCPGSRVHCVDESYMAVASARETLQDAFGQTVSASFHAAWNLSGFDAGSAALVLCNPPFHQQHIVGDQIATAMFRDARQVLAEGGELWVVGNRHLGYHKTLKRLFGNAELVASSPKFIILRAVRRKVLDHH